MAQTVVKPTPAESKNTPAEDAGKDTAVQTDQPNYDPWSADARPADLGVRLCALEDATYGANARPPLFSDDSEGKE